MSDRKAPWEKVKPDPESEAWNKLPWRKLEQHVFRIQKRIYRASQHGNQRAVHKLQKLLMKSEAARLLATQQVTQTRQDSTNTGKDGMKSVQTKLRPALVKQIHPRRWQRQKSRSTSRVSLLRDGTIRRRQASTSALRVQAQQALVRLALEPEWEACFAPDSYGLRHGRSCHDAIAAIRRAIRAKDTYVLNANLNGCFANLNHKALLCKLETFSAARNAIQAWLKAGMVDNRACLSASQQDDCAVSSLLTSIALHGMEEYLQQAFKASEIQPQLVRYATDFVVFHPTLEGLLQAKAVLETWLQSMGLELKPEQTRITHTLKPYQGNVGFDFLGWTVRQYPAGKRRAENNVYGQPSGLKTTIRPGKTHVQIHMREIKKIINQNGSKSQKQLIRALNPVIWKWTDHYKTMGTAEEFSRCDHYLWRKLWSWTRRRHPNKGQGWRYARYWQTVADRQVFSTPEGLKLRQHTQNKGQGPASQSSHGGTTLS